jgi:GTP-binding protein
MPQTRFVLRQALQRGLKVILVVNKIDRPNARPEYAVNAAFDLFIDLEASEEQADFPVIYTKALEGMAGHEPDDLALDLTPLFETIIGYLPPPMVDEHGPTQLLVTTLEYSPYVGKIAIGRLTSGNIKEGQAITHITAQGEMKEGKISKTYLFRNLQRVSQPIVHAGNIVAVAGIPDVGIGDTLADPDDPRPLPPITVEEPTVRMTFSINDSPFAGKEGQYLTSRQIRERLFRELESNVALRVKETDTAGTFIVSGRGELHLAVFIETMRREGYEFSVSRPEVIFKDSPQGKLEPMEQLFLEVHTDYYGAVSEMLGRRRGIVANIRYGDDGTVYAEYVVPTRGTLGFRQPFLTTTRGTGIYHTLFHGFEPFKGEINSQDLGSLISLESGTVSAYALTSLQQRGMFFVKPGDAVYAGQVVGENIRDEEMVVNVCRTKHLTNHRSTPTAMAEQLTPPRVLSLDDAIEYLGDDDLLEVTPASLRVRKRVLRHDTRQKMAKRAKKVAA